MARVPGSEMITSRAGTLVITVLLLGLASYGIFEQQAPELSGAIVGFVGAYWLPARILPGQRGRTIDRG